MRDRALAARDRLVDRAVVARLQHAEHEQPDEQEREDGDGEGRDGAAHAQAQG